MPLTLPLTFFLTAAPRIFPQHRAAAGGAGRRPWGCGGAAQPAVGGRAAGHAACAAVAGLPGRRYGRGGGRKGMQWINSHSLTPSLHHTPCCARQAEKLTLLEASSASRKTEQLLADYKEVWRVGEVVAWE